MKRPFVLEEDLLNADWTKWRMPDVGIDGKPIVPKFYPDSGKSKKIQTSEEEQKDG